MTKKLPSLSLPLSKVPFRPSERTLPGAGKKLAEFAKDPQATIRENSKAVLDKVLPKEIAAAQPNFARPVDVSDRASVFGAVTSHVDASLSKTGVTDIVKHAFTASSLLNPFTSALGIATLTDTILEKYDDKILKIPVIGTIAKPFIKVRKWVKKKILKPIDKAFKPVEKFVKKAWNKTKNFFKNLFS